MPRYTPSLYSQNQTKHLAHHNAVRLTGFSDILPSWVEAYTYFDGDAGGTLLALLFCGKWANMLIRNEPYDDASMRILLRECMHHVVIAMTAGEANRPFRKALKGYGWLRNLDIIHDLKEPKDGPPHPGPHRKGGPKPAAKPRHDPPAGSGL